MFVFEDIGWIGLITVLFILFHFLFEKILHFKNFTFLNVMFWRLEIIAGIYYAFTSLAIEALIWQFNPQFTIPTGVLTSLALVTLRSPLAAIINVFPSLIFYTLLFPISDLTYVMYGITTGAMTIYVLLDFFTKRAMMVKSLLMALVVVSAAAVYLVFLVEGSYYGREFYEATLLFGIFAGFTIGGVTYFMSVFKSANILFDSVTFAYYSYYRHAVARVAIQNLIKREKLKDGIYVVFKYNLMNSVSPEAREELTKQFLLEFEKSLPKNTIAFVVERDVHGLFLPIQNRGKIHDSLAGNAMAKRNSDDALRGIEKIFKRVEREYFSVLGERSFIQARAGASFYGLQDSSLVKLEQNAIFAANTFNSKGQNTVSLYDPKKLKNVLIDSKSLLNMDYALSLDNFDNELMGVYSLEQERWVGVYSQVQNASEFNLINSVREHIKLNGWVSEFDRYFAVNTLQELPPKEFDEIMFNYSPILLTEDVDFAQIESKISKFDLQPKNIIFVLDEVPNKKFQFENIQKAKEFGFKLAIQNITDLKTIENIDPNWIIISPENFSKDFSSFKNKVIFGNISSLENLKTAKKNGALFYSGALLQEEDISKNLDISYKKSKITLKQLINETEKGGNHG